MARYLSVQLGGGEGLFTVGVYDLILLDLNLPDMSGYEVLRTLRLSKVKTPILILSGMAGIEDKVRDMIGGKSTAPGMASAKSISGKAAE